MRLRIDVHAIKKQHVEMDIEVERGAEALDEINRTGVGRGACMTCLPDQVTGNHAVDDAQHAPHDPRPVGEV